MAVGLGPIRLAAVLASVVVLAGCAAPVAAGGDWRQARVREVVVLPDGRRAARVSHYHGGTVMSTELIVPDGEVVRPGDQVWFDHSAREKRLTTQPPENAQRR